MNAEELNIALQDIENKLSAIEQYLESIETSECPDYDFEEKLLQNKAYLLQKKA